MVALLTLQLSLITRSCNVQEICVTHALIKLFFLTSLARVMLVSRALPLRVLFFQIYAAGHLLSLGSSVIL
jgi:hypothetical protein